MNANGQRPDVRMPDEHIEWLAREHKVPKNQICCICGTVITVQIFKNTGVCCEKHRKDRDNDHQPFRGGSLAP